MKRLAIAVCLALVLTGCATTRWESTELIEKQHLKVNLERRIEKDRPVAQGYDHPATVSADAIETILADISYMAPPRIWGDSEKRPVFQPEERKRLAPALSMALSKATPDQRIRFTSYNRGGGLLFSDRRKTEAVIYVDDKPRLHIAFSHINTALQHDQRPETVTTASKDPLEITSTDTPIVVRGDYITHHQPSQSGQKRPMWVEANLEKAKTKSRKDRPAPAEPGQNQEQAGQGPEETAAPAPSVSGKDETKSPAAAPDQWQDRKQKIRTRLKYLKELYEDGLIDQTEYEAKKQQILNQIQ
ncbi:MAG: SHOCT domain-containing protein [Thermodesulfobacteriota bacterium]